MFYQQSEGIILPRRPKNLHKTNAAFKNYTREEVIKMTKLELFLFLFPVYYLKEILIPEINKLLEHPMELGEFIWCLGCWFYIGCWVRIPNSSNWWSTVEPTMSGGAPFRIDKYMSSTRFEGII